MNRSGQTETGRNEMQNDRQGAGQNAQNGDQNGQSVRRETHVNPQAVRAEGNANLTKDKAARVADTLMATARPQNVNVDVHVGALLPGEDDLMPLPPTIVDLVPEYRGCDYVVVNDEIVIVQPSTRNVVEVINTGGGRAMNEGGAEAMAGTRLNPCATPYSVERADEAASQASQCLGPGALAVEGEHELFGFLTTEANAIVAPIQPKAMPVVLTSAAEVDRCSRSKLRRDSRIALGKPAGGP